MRLWRREHFSLPLENGDTNGIIFSLVSYFVVFWKNGLTPNELRITQKAGSAHFGLRSCHSCMLKSVMQSITRRRVRLS